MRSFGMGAGLVLAVLLQSTAAADEASVRADVRCVIVSIRIMQLQDPNLQKAGTMSALYFFGRLDGASPSLDLEERIVKELTIMTPEDYKTESARCGGELQVRGQALQEIGGSLIKRGEKMEKQPAGERPKESAQRVN
jgi:hypothetical protein